MAHTVIEEIKDRLLADGNFDCLMNTDINDFRTKFGHGVTTTPMNISQLYTTGTLADGAKAAGLDSTDAVMMAAGTILIEQGILGYNIPTPDGSNKVADYIAESYDGSQGADKFVTTCVNFIIYYLFEVAFVDMLANKLKAAGKYIESFSINFKSPAYEMAADAISVYMKSGTRYANCAIELIFYMPRLDSPDFEVETFDTLADSYYVKVSAHGLQHYGGVQNLNDYSDAMCLSGINVDWLKKLLKEFRKINNI